MSEPQRPAVGLGETLQFLLELASLFGIGLIGWNMGDRGILGAILAVVLIILTGTIWGRFRTPGFVPTGRPPTFPVDGKTRIAIELGVFAAGIFGLWYGGYTMTALVTLVVLVLMLIALRYRYIALWNTTV